MRTGIISKLRKGFEEWEERVTMTCFFTGRRYEIPLVSTYVTYIRTEQGFSGVWTKSAAIMSQDGQIYENHGE